MQGEAQRFRRKPLALPALAFAAGVAAAAAAGPAGVALAAAPAALAAVALAARRRGAAMILAVCASAAIAGAVRLLSCGPALHPEASFVEPGEPVTVRFRAHVVSVEPGAGALEPKPSTIFIAAITRIEKAGEMAPGRGRVRVRVNGKVSLRRGDQVEVTGTLRDLLSAGNPGQFDAAGRLAERGLGGAVFSPSADCVRVIGKGGPGPLVLLESARLGMAAALAQAMPGDGGALLSALLLGDQRRVSRESRDAFSRSGTIHLLAVSGLHLMLLTGGLYLLLRLASTPVKASACILILFSWTYAALTGGRDPVLRAATMTTAYFVADLAGRERDSWNALSASGLLILFLRPFDLFNAGFQLSFAAVAGILAFSRPIAVFLTGEERIVLDLSIFPRDRARAWAMNWLGGSISVSMAAWIATAPLLWLHFNLITPVVPLANIAAGPLAAAALAAGMLAVPAACTLPGAWPLFAPAEAAAWALSQLARFFASLPLSHFYLPAPPAWRVGAAYACLVWIAARPFLPRKIAGLHWTLPALLAAVALFAPSTGKRPDGMEVTVLDVGHGLCVVARFDDGRVLVCDAGAKGGFDAGPMVVAPFLWSRGVSRIDLLVISHCDEDHISAVGPVCDRFWVEAVMVHPGFSTYSEGRRVLEILERRGIPVCFAGRGQEAPRAFRDEIDILHPPPGSGSAGLSRNDRSLTISVEYAGRRILIPGDLERKGLEELVRSCPAKFDAIVAPHHGSSELEGNLPFAAERPAFVVASCERSFCVADTEYAYRNFGALFFKTWRDGAVTIRVGPDSSMEAERFRGGAIFRDPRPRSRSLPGSGPSPPPR